MRSAFGANNTFLICDWPRPRNLLSDWDYCLQRVLIDRSQLPFEAKMAFLCCSCGLPVKRVSEKPTATEFNLPCETQAPEGIRVPRP